MNFKQRLKKLETVIDPTGVCACFPKVRTEIHKADLSEDSDSSEPALWGKPVPDVCPDCRKPIEKTQIILQFCDHTTKDRFPDEWKAK